MAVPFALSVHTFIHNVGSYVGFASIVGLALLVLLNFAQARETATLRKRLEDSDDRIVSLESRLSQSVRQAQPAVRAVPATPGAAPTVTPAPAGARSAAVRRLPAPAALARTFLGAPAGVGAPALASATKMVTTALPGRPARVPSVAPAPAVVGAPPPGVGAAPAPGVTGAPAPAVAAAVAAQDEGPQPDDTLLVAPATAAAARGNGHEQTVVAPPVTPPPAAAPQPAAATPPAAPPPVSPPPPRAQIRPEPSRPPRRTAPLPPKRRSPARRVLPAVLGVLLIAVIVVAVLVVMRNNSSSTTASSGRHHPVVHFHPSRVTVAVLNGTDVTHLAKRVATRLHQSGYQQGTIANANVQTQARTIVAYVSGHREAAIHVAKALQVSRGSISRADNAAISACTTGATTSGGSCSADVIVTVGHNLAHLARAAGAG